MRAVRRQMQYVFQDPYSSLNPVLTVGEIVAEPLRIHGLYDEMGGAARIAELFDMVGLSRVDARAATRASSRAGRSSASASPARSRCKPRLLILDEPVAALDVSIQAQIINLLQDLQRELGLAYLFIAHDLSVVRHISDRVAVMYLGRIVEESDEGRALRRSRRIPTRSRCSRPCRCPIPRRATRARRIVLQGEIPNPASPPPGCTFHPRCFRASARCAAEAPAFEPYPGAADRAAPAIMPALRSASGPPASRAAWSAAP